MRPTHTAIMGMVYVITYEDSVLNRQTLGYIDLWANHITIAAEACKVQKKQTLLHEVLHALDINMGLGNVVTEEQNATRSNLLFEWLRNPDNRDAIEWIIHDGPKPKRSKNANR